MLNKYGITNIPICPVCGSNKCQSSIKYSKVSVMQNYVENTEEQAKKSTSGEIDLCLCKECGFIFNAEYNESKLKYIGGYDNNRDYSGKYTHYMKEVEDLIGNSLELKNKRVLEVGCGNGNFLISICQRYGCKGYGYDPAYSGEETVANGQVHFYNKYYDNECKSEEDKFDLVIFRHTVEHLQYPTKLLSQLRNSMKEQGVIYIETPCFNWILKNKIVFDIFYEHCSYYTKDSMENLLKLVGLKPVKTEYKFNNQYMCMIAKYSSESFEINRDFIRDLEEDINNFNLYIQILTNDIREYLKELSTQGNICLWGAAAKGSTFCCIFDREKALIECLVDINVKKQGKFISVSGHEIIAPSEITEKRIKYVIVTNSVYYEEISQMVKDIDVSIELIELEKMMTKFV